MTSQVSNVSQERQSRFFFHSEFYFWSGQGYNWSVYADLIVHSLCPPSRVLNSSEHQSGKNQYRTSASPFWPIQASPIEFRLPINIYNLSL